MTTASRQPSAAQAATARASRRNAAPPRKPLSPDGHVPPAPMLVAEIRASRQLLADLDMLSEKYGALFAPVASTVRDRLDAREAVLAAAQNGAQGNLLWFVTRERATPSGGGSYRR